MQIRLSLCAGIAALLLASCAGESGSPSEAAGDVGEDTDVVAGADETDKDLCGAADYQSLVGSNMAAVTLPAELNHRVIGPNDAVTMDYNPERLNIYTDEDGVVTEVKCG